MAGIILCLLNGKGLGAQTTGGIVVGAERMDVYLPLVQGHAVSVVANHTSLVGTRHLVDTLTSIGCNLHSIFCPEHGFRGTAAAGAHIANGRDERTGLPIVSLYGKNKKPTAEQLQGIDIVIFDLQDVGCRFYTYISTLHYVMEACAEEGVPLMVLDRPNPNGHYVDGPVMEQEYTSFVGMKAGLPVVYGMTMGEYAQMIDSELTHRKEGYHLTVIPLLNYTHDSIYQLPVPPSPNLRTAQAVALYPSLCLFEGTTISVGRGTPYPFEVIGNDYKMDLRTVPVAARFDLHYLREMLAHSEKDNFFLKNNFFEKLAGNGQLRKQLLEGEGDEAIRASWQPQLDAFKQYRKRFLLYPDATQAN
ncbi:MAG: DUF1343 domain-containing protein [Bacteroidales bacterium]|nr:DUF1343 domain-containing protein [Bacteroidales bacterium]